MSAIKLVLKVITLTVSRIIYLINLNHTTYVMNIVRVPILLFFAHPTGRASSDLKK